MVLDDGTEQVGRQGELTGLCQMESWERLRAGHGKGEDKHGTGQVGRHGELAGIGYT